jgi:hypothetical protein
MAQAASVYTSDAGRAWENRAVKILKPARAPDAVNKYGGALKYRLRATGFFYVTEKSGRWWLVDPDGCLFIMKGVNSVQSERVGRTDAEQWAKDTYVLLKETGFNTIGRWSEQDAFKDAGVSVPWCSTTSFMKAYAGQRPSKYGARGFPGQTLPVFDGAWPEFCKRYAETEVSELADDPWLLGHFSDNELPFRPDALNNYLSLPERDAGHRAAVDWMRDNRVKKSDLKDPQVQADFLEVVARRYFETVAVALKKADPNHLYLGSRLHGRCISEPVIRAAGSCDVISINYYHRWEPEKDRIEAWEEWSGRPFFVSEFYAMRVESKETEPVGAGFRVFNFEDAAAFYHTYVVGLLEAPSCVGWHWFKYADDTPEWQKGIVGVDGSVHQPLVDGMKSINDQVYSLRGLR